MSEQVQDAKRNAALGHFVRRGIPFAVLLAVAIIAYLYWQRVDHRPQPAAGTPVPAPVPVHVLTVQKETVPIVRRFLGQTEASQVIEIRARIAGYLQERTFNEGERVKKGQKLFQIDPRPFEVEVAQAKAQLASAQATLERAGQQLRRVQVLGERRVAAEEEVEDWQTQQRVAAAAVQQQQAQIAAAELQLHYASVEAPIAGRIGRALKDTGSYVDAGQNGLLAVIQQVDPMYVRYAVTEHEILRFKRQIAAKQIVAPEVEQVELEITLSDGSIYRHRGRINFLDVQVDKTTGTSVVRGQVPNPDDWLKPGQFIYASILGIQRLDVMRVPQAAVLQSPIGASVYVVNDQNRVESRPVTLGEWSGNDQWIVERGLQPGERVVVDRLMQVRPGSPVTIAAPAPTTSRTHAQPPTGEPTVPRERKERR